MGKFKKNKSLKGQAISTSSLPDIVFMLLFFFMVTTVMRERTMQVQQRLPKATEVKKLEKKSLVSFIYIGKPHKQYKINDNKWKYDFQIQEEESFIQINDVLSTNPFSNNPSTPSDIYNYIIEEREERDEKEIPFMTTSLKCDTAARMGIITLVKQELRKANAFKINYSTKKKD